MSEVAESGTAVKVKRNPPPTRRQRDRREEARGAAAAEAAPQAAKPDRGRTKKGPQR